MMVVGHVRQVGPLHADQVELEGVVAAVAIGRKTAQYKHRILIDKLRQNCLSVYCT